MSCRTPPLLRPPAGLGSSGAPTRKHLPFPASPLAGAGLLMEPWEVLSSAAFSRPPERYHEANKPVRSSGPPHKKGYFSLAPQLAGGFVEALLHVGMRGPRLLPSGDPFSPRAPESKEGGCDGPGLRGVGTSLPHHEPVCKGGWETPSSCVSRRHALGSVYSRHRCCVGIPASRAQTWTDLEGELGGGPQGGLEGRSHL